MTFHKKESWLPPHVLTLKSDRRGTPSRQGVQLELKLGQPPAVPPLRFTVIEVWAANVGPHVSA